MAISNHRLLAFEHEHVTFHGKNYAHGGKRGQMTPVATEFLRRFFLHVLPRGFVRIRRPSSVEESPQANLSAWFLRIHSSTSFRTRTAILPQ